MTEPKRRVSLLPGEEFRRSGLGKIIYWTTSTGRYVVVLVEFVVILAFLSRFWLDRKNADLSEEIRQEKAIIESVGEFEEDFAALQKQLEQIKQMLETEGAGKEALETVVNLSSGDVVFESISQSLGEDGLGMVSLEATVYSERGLVSFIKALSESPKVSTVKIDNIGKDAKISGYRLGLQVGINKTVKEKEVADGQ